MNTGSRRYLAVGVAAVMVLLPSVGRGQVTLDFTWNQLDMQTFFVADFIDLAQESYDVSSHPELFTAISSGAMPSSNRNSRLGLSAPVGQTPTHWPQNTQVDSGMERSKNVPISVS